MQTAVTVLILELVKSLPFNIPEAWKRYPPRAEPPQIGHYGVYHSPPPPPPHPIVSSPFLKLFVAFFFLAEKCFQSVEVSLFLFVKLNVGSTVTLFSQHD